MPLDELLALYGYGNQQGDGEGDGEGEGGEVSEAESEEGAEGMATTATDVPDEDEEVASDDEPQQPSELSRLYEEPIYEPEPLAAVAGAVSPPTAGVVNSVTVRTVNSAVDDASRLLRCKCIILFRNRQFFNMVCFCSGVTCPQ